MKQKKRNFGEMTPIEIEQWEVKTRTIVVFDDENGIAFQKSKNLEDNETALVIMFNNAKRKNTVVLFGDELKKLKKFITED